MRPAVVVLTGASGAGKTTLLSALAARELPGVTCVNCDRIALPAGSPDGAQIVHWIEKLRSDPQIEVAILDTQIRPHRARALLSELGVVHSAVVLVDCQHETRHERLRGPRGQPDLANGQMDCWAAYLRGQADALGLPIVSTMCPIEEAAQHLETLVAEVRRAAAT